jgi:hypothetical protein
MPEDLLVWHSLPGIALHSLYYCIESNRD